MDVGYDLDVAQVQGPGSQEEGLADEVGGWGGLGVRPLALLQLRLLLGLQVQLGLLLEVQPLVLGGIAARCAGSALSG